MKEKRELSLDDLELVTGGTGKKNCPYFVQALRKSYVNQCENCRYYYKKKNGEYDCSNPIKNRSETSFI